MSSREPLTAASENSEPRPPQDSDDAPRSTLIFSGDEPPLSLPPNSRRPMVVVRSGDGANVPDWSAESPTPPVASEITAIPPVSTADTAPASVREPLPSEPAPSEPFPLARDLEPPPPSAPVAIDRASVGAWEDQQLDSPELESGSLPLARPAESALPRVATLPPIPNTASAPPPAAPSVAPASLQTPAHSPERASSRGWLWKLGAPLAIAAAALLFLRSGSAPEPATPEPKAAVETTRSEAAPVVAPPAETSSETAVAKKPEDPPTAPSAAPEAKRAEPAEPAEPAARKSSPSGVTSKPVPPGATRVRLVVHPPDSKVGRRGVTQKPPYEFDVPKGKKIVLEVLHKGYTTRKVTLDGSSKRVVVGLTRPRSRSSR
jgi:hypothetical protein